MSSTTKHPTSTAATPYRDPAIAAPDPTDDPRAHDLMKAQPATIHDWGSRLHSLAHLAHETSSNLQQIAGGVHWTGDGAHRFLATVKQITPALENLSEAYAAASYSIWTYSDSVDTDQHLFRRAGEQIDGMTEVLRTIDPTHGGGTPSTTAVGDQQQLSTAKANGFSVLDDFEAARRKVGMSLKELAARAPHHPPWWQKNMAAVINQMAGLKGVTKRDRERAADLAAAEAAYAKDPSEANRKRLEQDLAATHAIATAAARDGHSGLAKQLLADEAGSLQRLSDKQQGLLGSHKHYLATTLEQEQAVRDLKSGHISAAEGALGVMAATTVGQYASHAGRGATVKGTEAAHKEAEQLAQQQAGNHDSGNHDSGNHDTGNHDSGNHDTGNHHPGSAPAPGHVHPLTTSSPIEIKGMKPSASQVANLNAVLAQAAKLHAPHQACVALVEACIQESTCENLSYGDGSSTGILQFLSSTAHDLGIDPRNVSQCADAFLTRNYYYGAPFHGDAKGAIGYAIAHPHATACEIAQSCQGSAYPSAYGQWQGEAEKIVAQYGLG